MWCTLGGGGGGGGGNNDKSMFCDNRLQSLIAMATWYQKLVPSLAHLVLAGSS